MAKKQYGVAASNPLDAVTKADLDAIAGGGSSDTTIVRDDFNRADNATTPGSPVVGPAGSPTTGSTGGISGNRFYFPTVSGTWQAFTYPTGKVDVVAEVTMPVVTTGETPGLALRLLNAASANDGLFFTHSRMYCLVANAYVGSTQQAYGQNIVGGDRLRVTVSGRQARVFRKIANAGDWVFVSRHDIPTSALDTATNHGLGRSGTGAGTSRYDDLWIGEMTPEIEQECREAETRARGGGGRGTLSTSTPNLTASAANLIPGTTIQLATGELKVGQRFRWVLGVEKKTAAGTATWSVAIRGGTGVATDTAIASWTSGTNTAAVDQAILILEAEVTSHSDTQVTFNCMAFYVNTLTNVTGLGKIAPVPTTTALLNYGADPKLHVTFTPGASAVMGAIASAELLRGAPVYPV